MNKQLSKNERNYLFVEIGDHLEIAVNTIYLNRVLRNACVAEDMNVRVPGLTGEEQNVG